MIMISDSDKLITVCFATASLEGRRLQAPREPLGFGALVAIAAASATPTKTHDDE